jgi:hypothetical protein
MLIVWMNIAPGHEEDFDGWFTRQHVPERVGVPGFRAGGRYEALRGEPHFLSVYETDSPDVLTSAPYKERLANPTPWTQRVMPNFRDTIRVTGSVIVEAGLGIGGVRRLIRIDPPEAQRAAVRGVLTQALAEKVLAERGVTRVRVVEGPPVSPTAQTPESQMRGPDRSAIFTVLIDGQDEAGLERGGKVLHAALNQHRGLLSQPPAMGDYKLLFHLNR